MNTQFPPMTVQLPEAAKILGVSPHTLRAWTRAGKVPVVRNDRRLRYSVEALKQWVASRSAPAAEGASA